MNLQETAKLLTMIQSLYPSQMKSSEDSNFELTTRLWQRLFNDADFKQVIEALLEYATLNKFAPHPSDIKDIMAKRNNPEAFKPAEIAWEEVTQAIKRFGYYRQQEAFATFDDKVKRAVKAVGWGTICHSERIDMVRKNFCDYWKSMSSVEQEQVKLSFPKDSVNKIKGMISGEMS